MNEFPQMTREEAIEFYYSGTWKNWSAGELARFQLNQELLCIPLDVYDAALSAMLGRKAYTHEFALNLEGMNDELDETGLPPDHELMLAAFDTIRLEFNNDEFV